MGGFNFDFSQMNPYITGMADRSMRAMDYNLAQQPKRERLNDRAYAEWLNNNRSKRNIAESDAGLRARGYDAAAALAGREEKRAGSARFEEDQEKRRALMTSLAAAQTAGYNPVPGSRGYAGVIRDFYTYGPWARGGRGGGGSAGGGTTVAYEPQWKPPTYTKASSYTNPWAHL